MKNQYINAPTVATHISTGDGSKGKRWPGNWPTTVVTFPAARVLVYEDSLQWHEFGLPGPV